jgi:2-dehydro-3-deoxyglucarate aldolase
MNRLKKINEIRKALANNKASIGSWIQIPHSSIAEIMGDAGYDWIAVDMEHGAVSTHQLPDLFRALELNNTLPLARLAHAHPKDCKLALDAGAGGVIVPMVESATQLIAVREACQWPPSGKRGIGFSRANLFGKYFDNYLEEAQAPLLIAMIEHFRAVENLDEILNVVGLDGILIGPYDLSASMDLTGQFDNAIFKEIMSSIQKKCKKARIPYGMHLVNPDTDQLHKKINEGYQLIAYSIDAVFLNNSCAAPIASNL